MKRHHDIVGDGGSRVLEQVAEQCTRITDGLAGVPARDRGHSAVERRVRPDMARDRAAAAARFTAMDLAFLDHIDVLEPAERWAARP